MSAQALIRQAQASGVALRLVGGKVKASGPREAVARLLVPLREHRAALADALQAEPVEPLPSTPTDGGPPLQLLHLHRRRAWQPVWVALWNRGGALAGLFGGLSGSNCLHCTKVASDDVPSNYTAIHFHRKGDVCNRTISCLAQL